MFILVFFYVFNDPGVLFDADLSRLRLASWKRVTSATTKYQAISRWSFPAAGLTSLLAAITCLIVFTTVWDLPAIEDIGGVINRHYTTLALGRALDLSLAAFAYFKAPLILAIVAFSMGAAVCLARSEHMRFAGLIAMMVIFFQAARLALIALDPYLSTRALAAEFKQHEPGRVVIDDQYYNFSSVFFYADLTSAFLLNGRKVNLEYGSYAPGAPSVFLEDAELPIKWHGDSRYYLFCFESAYPRLEKLLGSNSIYAIDKSGTKMLITNHPVHMVTRGE